ncbi:MAG: tetratricopeptide repeat protein [Candidatus Latescibacteria bacterium]|nr:tetratricopeptide repeat protein [Candidatus Latescibacterota bacterium]
MFDDLGKVEKLYRKHPQSPLFARLADLYLRRGKVERALALCQEGCKRFPHYPTGYLILGKCYEAQGHLEEARSATDQSLRLDPENPAGFMRLSKIYQDLGIATLALKSLQQAARFDPLSEQLAEQVDQLTYTVRVESAAAAPGAPEAIDMRPPPPEATTVARPLETPAPAAEAEPFALIHVPQEEPPPAEAEAEPIIAYASPLEEENLEDLLKRSEEAMAERETLAALSPPPPEPAAPVADLPLEDRLEALFRRGNLAAPEPEPAAAPEPFAAPLAEPEPEPVAPPALDEDLFALGAALMAGDSPLEPEPAIAAEEPEPSLIQEEGLFSPAPPDPAAIAIEPENSELEEGLFATLSAGTDLPPSVALPPGESAEDLRLDDLIAPPPAPSPRPEVVNLLPEAQAAAPIADTADEELPIAAEPVPAAEIVEPPAPQTEPARPRRADDGELIRLFQEIENQQHQALVTQPPAAPQPGSPPADASDPEGRIATVTLAQIYSSQGFVDRAVETYRKILDQDPDNEEIKRRIAELQQGRKSN